MKINIFSYLYCCLPRHDYQPPIFPQAQAQAQTRLDRGPTMSNHSQEKSIATLSNELNLATFVASSGVLGQLWGAISQTKVDFKDQLSGSNPTVRFQVEELPKYNILVFVASPISKTRLLEKTEPVPSSAISGFDFLLSSRRKSSFSINEAALSLFDSRKDDLSALVTKIAKEAESKPFIITGDGISGSVASLFTLHLLYSLDTQKAKPPLCVTFGSPLLGDSGLCKAISGYTTWNSCFLHVVSMDDCFPSLFVQPSHPAGGQTTGNKSTYQPFGKFMFSSESGGACFEDPESALILLRKMSAESGQNEQSFDYAHIIASLRKGSICKDKTNLNADGTGSSRRKPSVAAQYLAALFKCQDAGASFKLEELLKNETIFLDLKRQELQRAAKELNDIKVYMTYMEWYKKKSEENKIPYYDSYKNQSVKADFDVNRFKGNLQNYWVRLVKEADQKPQKAEKALRVRWLFGGTNYRRMVEPLAIADHYKSEGARDYINKRRSEERLKHYEQLEELFNLDQTGKLKKQNVRPPSLTEDSCFWAHVEEAIISCKNLNKGKSDENEIESLKTFEKYVLELIENYTVSSDIFWEKSSFMKWWKEYEEVLDKKLMGTSYTSPLFHIMHEGEYNRYKTGDLFI